MPPAANHDSAMQIACPKCGALTVSKGIKTTDIAGGPSTGLLYFLFAPFLARQFCPVHGRLERSEFPPVIRRRLLLIPIVWLALALTIVVAFGWLMVKWIQ